ncbi:MAG: hypothetical protein HETSPECPRED_002807 [Heterodermia speciosa]|uniref:Lysine-specific metallo-endopeptidase domain-containing protein n=1 Tax=Heterodermia speciosa TaxID=116794 RepID=A0A8H3F318_9LECA|nr:MAG: hypothetical protein HETSPECPRED_002807 [Heterodermia speciosa]
MKFPFAPVAFLIFGICSGLFIGAVEATSTRSWRRVLSSRVSQLGLRAGGSFDAALTFKRVQKTCPQPAVNDAGQQMTEMAQAASAAMDDLVNDRPNGKAQSMYNSVFGQENDADLRKGYYKIVKDVFDSIAAFTNSGSDWSLYCDESWATYHPFSKTEEDEDGKTKIGYWMAKDPTEFSRDQHFEGGISGVCSAGTLAWTLHGPNVIQLCPMLFNKGVAGIISSNVPVTIPQDQSYGEKEKRIDQMNTMASTFLHEMAHQVKDTIDDLPAIRNDGTEAGTTLKDKVGNILALGFRNTSMFALPFFRSLRDALLTLWTSIESYGWKYVYNLGRFRTPSARQNADSYMNFAIGVYYTGNDWSTGVSR